MGRERRRRRAGGDEPAVQLVGEQQVAELRARVGREPVVAALGPEIVEVEAVGEAIKRGILPIVGGDLPFPDYNVAGGGYVADDALERIIDRAIEVGADHFVIPGNTPEKLRYHAARLKAKLKAPVFVVPGIGPLGGKLGDLVAAAAGCSVYGVVGRAVYGAADQAAAARRLVDEAMAAA